MARRRYIEAINDALFEEMERDERVVLFGEDVEVSLFGDTRNLVDRFGRSRIRNTPICEAALTGMAVGAAANGYRVILHMMYSNFLYTGFDAIANQMCKLRLMTGGQIQLPITIMAGYGGGRSSAAQHSDTPYPLLMNLGGINVLTPATPADAKGLLKQAIRTDGPSVFLEAIGRGGEIGDVPEEDYVVEFGRAAVVQPGEDVTVVAIGPMVKLATEAVKELADRGVSVELIDPRTLVPLDEETLLTSIAKTGRLVIVDEARDRCSAASQIAAIGAERGFHDLRAPIRRITVPNVAMPFAPSAEMAIRPNSGVIVQAAVELMEERTAQMAR